MYSREWRIRAVHSFLSWTARPSPNRHSHWYHSAFNFSCTCFWCPLQHVFGGASVAPRALKKGLSMSDFDYKNTEEMPEWAVVHSTAIHDRGRERVVLQYQAALAGLLVGREYDFLEVNFLEAGTVCFSHSEDLPDELIASIELLGELAMSAMQLESQKGQNLTKFGAPSHRVFSLPSRDDLSTGRDEDTSKRMKKVLEKLKKTGTHRQLAIPEPGWRDKADEIRRNFPNFTRVMDTVITPHLSILDAGGSHRMGPVLLVGEPGVGKTYFANAVAKLFGFRESIFIDFSAETNNSALGGSSNFWSNSSPGKLFDYLAWGDGETSFANPVFVLDEIDKTSPESRYNPLSTLYGILEAETAAKFYDQSMPDIGLDVSRVRFFLTANDASKIPEPLLTRLTVFHIPAPTPEQLRGVVRGIYSAIAKGIGIGLSDEIGDDIIDLAEGLSPREARVRMECAIATAVAAGRLEIQVSDWPEIPTAASQKRRIGF